MKIFISAGEASGDALGARLLESLRRREPSLEAFGMGGPELVQAGLHQVRDASELGVVGLVEVIRHLPRLYRLLWDLADRAIAQRPDLAVLVDVPDFNVRLARHLRRAGIPVVFYVGPTVWAWRPGRVARWKREARRMLLLFPFETGIWQSAGVDARCVGHPLLDEIKSPRRTDEVDAKTIALLPGSRRSELRRLLPVMLAAGAELAARGRVERFVLPVAPTLDAEEIRRMIETEAPAIAPQVELVRSPPGDASPRRRAIARSAIALVASGTATLETALIGTPQVIVYRLSALSWWLGRPFVKVEHLGLPNLIAGRTIVPELLQNALTPEALATVAGDLLEDSAPQVAALGALRAALGPGAAAERAAEAILELVPSKSARAG
ncbi:MAG: lipid-A-disaccharide synthase [Deltaproteobacteria bacterium]|nr:lipid-A-disaccharide synthase [Deltaproteobacteria bacterium]